MNAPRTGATGGPIAITGARGRLGSALVGRLAEEDQAFLAWSRPEYDLDRPRSVERLLRRHHPAVVIHTAAWTDVDACTRDPDLARQRNAAAVAALARACHESGVALVLVSTNEVFDGTRHDGLGYRETDEPNPANAYGASKLEGERRASAAFGEADPRRPAEGLWIVRTAWLFGRGGADFPHKILAAADGLEQGGVLRVVDDEIGSPTFAADLAGAILSLIVKAPAGLYHVVNRGSVSRFGWAARVLARCARPVGLLPISQAEFVRASPPPAWAVLDPGRAERHGITLRGWEEAFDAYVQELCS